MAKNNPIYLATVCLDRNRWGSKQPAIKVSDWLDRIESDGFDGIELWEFHYTNADDAERARLIELAPRIPLYNIYATFGDEQQEVAARKQAAADITALNPTGFKYNVGRNADALDSYKRNVVEFAAQIPESTRLLCECHPGTPLETVDAAKAFFDDLDPTRFGVIAHSRNDPADLKPWVTAFGPRLQHLHVQAREPESDPDNPNVQAGIDACVDLLKAHSFAGSTSIEFTRGIGKDERLETIYANAVKDAAAYRKAWQR